MLCEEVGESDSERIEEIEEFRRKLNGALYAEIHTIAYFYKWTADTILSLTVEDRRRYIKLISQQIKLENGESDNEFEAGELLDEF